MAKRKANLGEGLVQTTVTKQLVTWLRTRSRAEGFTVAGYLRRLIIRDKEAHGRKA